VNLTELIDYVQRATVVYRKGDVVKEQGTVTVVDAFPAKPADADVVDCHFVTMGFTEAADTLTASEFRDAVVANPQGEFTNLTEADFATGPSYIAIGGWVGDQTLALRFMALGVHHGLWDIITPKRLGIDGPLADQMAGDGYVMTTGIKKAAA
jgi:hypothetical protein